MQNSSPSEGIVEEFCANEIVGPNNGYVETIIQDEESTAAIAVKSMQLNT